jgi:hypothetical protein
MSSEHVKLIAAVIVLLVLVTFFKDASHNYSSGERQRAERRDL